jgi:DNA-directed RNA polymerase subunit H (RpoH/RPB5)
MSVFQIVKTIISDNGFFHKRGILVDDNGLSTDNKIISSCENQFIKLESKRIIPRGVRTNFIILILCEDSKYATQSPKLKELLKNTLAVIDIDTLDELIIIVEDSFFLKKNMLDAIFELKKQGTSKYDPEGMLPYFNAYPFRNFIFNVPENVAVNKHEIINEKEFNETFKYRRPTDFPIIFSSDPPIIWNGAKHDQIVKIYRKDMSIYYRRVVNT